MSLQLHDVSVTYDGQQQPAVDTASLALKAGEIGVLVGPSGCGKTTLLRAIAGLEPVSGGRIALGGKTVSEGRHSLPSEDRHVGLVFQDYALFPHLSVLDNVQYGLQALPKMERTQRASAMLDLVGLGAQASRMPHELSGGQQQRVALARALAPRPALLLLDEPFSNLDVELRHRLAQDVRDIIRAAGVAALMVTHDQQEAFAIGDLIGIMRRGRIEQWADAPTVYHRPTTRFVAEFIGQGMLLPGTLSSADGETLALTALGALPVRFNETPMAHQDGEECDVLLRAHDLVLSPFADCMATLTHRRFRGADQLCTLQLADGSSVQACAPGDDACAVGDRVGISVKAGAVTAFLRQPRSPQAAPLPAKANPLQIAESKTRFHRFTAAA